MRAEWIVYSHTYVFIQNSSTQIHLHYVFIKQLKSCGAASPFQFDKWIRISSFEFLESSSACSVELTKKKTPDQRYKLLLDVSCSRIESASKCNRMVSMRNDVVFSSLLEQKKKKNEPGPFKRNRSKLFVWCVY